MLVHLSLWDSVVNIVNWLSNLANTLSSNERILAILATGGVAIIIGAIIIKLAVPS